MESIVATFLTYRFEQSAGYQSTALLIRRALPRPSMSFFNARISPTKPLKPKIHLQLIRSCSTPNSTRLRVGVFSTGCYNETPQFFRSDSSFPDIIQN
ncbi:hypothetical protein M513_04688 [Trichuris suis]|uniref:Uncharacterized protein n=1 Tax=Trichuris suis TaxID=68888 RepID=A0A085MAU9_9BILA|nr:hypothetical protein M513_04688 [Trichuris suis]